MSKKVQRPAPPKPLCIYCGVNPGTTKDHVIPECLFTVMPVVGTITVRVCRECNDQKSRDEHYFADFLQSHAFSMEHHPVAVELSQGRVLRSARLHTSDLVRELIQTYGHLLQENPDAIQDDELVWHPVDHERID